MLSLWVRPSSHVEMLIAHCDECWLLMSSRDRGGGERMFCAVNVINNMSEDGDKDTKDSDKAPRHLTTTSASETRSKLTLWKETIKIKHQSKFLTCKLMWNVKQIFRTRAVFLKRNRVVYRWMGACWSSEPSQLWSVRVNVLVSVFYGDSHCSIWRFLKG